jgi:glycosyltransferase involved in cell wall biosynthesis
MSKKKVLMLCDDIRSTSGVGIQAKYFAEALLDSGKYQVLNLGGALKHADPRPVKFQQYGDDLMIMPVEGYGDANMVRSIVHDYKPDVVWIMTDPRFWTWLWQIENEIRPLCPVVYYHVWDNLPYPKFNRPFYLSNDKIVTISKLTSDIVKTVTPEVDEEYLPHTVDENVFKPLPESEFGHLIPKDGRTLFYWISRNAQRKMSGSLVLWFSEFLNKVGKDKAKLIMHTDVRDEHGFDLDLLAREFGLTQDNFIISANRVPPQELAKFCNAADAVINISFAEGFGVGVLEAMACGTPAIINKTGGLQDQIFHDDGTELGVCIKPASTSLVGGLGIVPYIYEDRVSKEDFIAALEKIHNMTREERKTLGAKARENYLKKFSMDSYKTNWVRIMDEVIEKNGSWDTRKGYNKFVVEEI